MDMTFKVITQARPIHLGPMPIPVLHHAVLRIQRMVRSGLDKDAAYRGDHL